MEGVKDFVRLLESIILFENNRISLILYSNEKIYEHSNENIGYLQYIERNTLKVLVRLGEAW